jgi:AhpD family alkylhydroperoxidase
MKLDERTLRLIAIGASITANCQPCLQTNITEAMASGASIQEIADAIEVGRMVRQGAAAKMDNFVQSLENTASHIEGGGCGCGTQTAVHSQ